MNCTLESKQVQHKQCLDWIQPLYVTRETNTGYLESTRNLIVGTCCVSHRYLSIAYFMGQRICSTIVVRTWMDGRRSDVWTECLFVGICAGAFLHPVAEFSRVGTWAARSNSLLARYMTWRVALNCVAHVRGLTCALVWLSVRTLPSNARANS